MSARGSWPASCAAAILVVACAIALVELDIAVTIVTGAFLIAFGALALGFVLSLALAANAPSS